MARGAVRDGPVELHGCREVGREELGVSDTLEDRDLHPSLLPLPWALVAAEALQDLVLQGAAEALEECFFGGDGSCFLWALVVL